MKLEKFEIKNDCYYYDNKLLKVYKNSQGYNRVIILKKVHRLHRLIGLKYIPNLENKPIVDHIDNNKNNNNIENLQWLTYSENSKKAYNQVKSMSNFKTKNYTKKIIVSEKNDIKTEHRTLRDCAKFIERDVAAVYRVLNKEWNLSNGYKLYYK
jgi:hypothetical protein